MISLRPSDTGYPHRLRDLGKPPDPLWVRGELPDPSLPTVGIVGTRRLTPYGARVARELATVVASAGAVVVSGLAQGIDSTAHAAAIAAGAPTVAVLGEGLLVFEHAGPLRRRALAKAIYERGAIVSEFALDVRATSWTFPKRNATIAALSDVVIVVEAPHRSGALITAERADELRRPVYAVPGLLGEPTWAGSNELIATGRARLLADPARVLTFLGFGSPARSDGARMDPLLDLLAAGAADIDTIATGLRIPASKVPAAIARHLVAGTIVPTGDGRFARR